MLPAVKEETYGTLIILEITILCFFGYEHQTFPRLLVMRNFQITSDKI